MKIRNGFVSNSSSSSFVILGVPVTDEIKESLLKLANISEEEFEGKEYYGDYYELLNKAEVGDLDPYYVEGDEYNNIIGIALCKSEDWGLMDAEYSIDEINKIAKDVKEKLKLISGADVKLYMGTMPC